MNRMTLPILKKLLPVVALASVTASCELATVTEPALLPQFSGVAASAGIRVNGSGYLSHGEGESRIFTFSAIERPNGTVGGHFNLLITESLLGSSNPALVRLQAEVTCVSVVGNTAWVGGVVKSASNPEWVGGETAWAVQDNGSSGDQISLMYIPSPPGSGLAQRECDSQSEALVPNRTIEGGHVQVSTGPSGPAAPPSKPGPTLAPTEYCTANTPESVVTFEDPDLETVARIALGLSEAEVLDCATAATLKALAGGAAGGSEISSVWGVQNLVSLEALNLRVPHCDILPCGSLSDLTPLAGLTELRYVDLGRMYLPGIAPLAGLTNLRELHVFGAESISDLTPLSGLTSLRVLSLANNPISDLSPIAALTAVEDLNLVNTGVIDLVPLSGMTAMKLLYIGTNPWTLTDIAPLAPMTQLQVLGLGFNGISDVSVIAGFPDLYWLDLGDNQISDISALRGLTSLDLVQLYGNANLSDIRPLVDNLDLAAGDHVDLADVSPNMACSDVAALEARGVSVAYTTCS